ncbi:hypothetical protein ACLOJK_029676, partial [Asimina triloba]
MGKESREDEDDRLLMRCECDVGRETWHQPPDKGNEVMYPPPVDSSQAPRAPRASDAHWEKSLNTEAPHSMEALMDTVGTKSSPEIQRS